MKKRLLLLIVCVLLLLSAVHAEQSAAIIGQWETEILGHHYLLEFLEDGTLRCYEEDLSRSTQSSRFYKADPCDVLTYERSGNELFVNMQMMFYPEGDRLHLWRRYDGSYMTSLDLHDTAGANSDAVINSADPAVYPSTLTFGAKVPHSSFAGYSSELPGFSVTLKADMSGSITENYMEEVNRFDIRWSYSDTMLIMTHGGDRYTVTFSGGNGIYDSFYGEKVNVVLPAQAEQFFTGALGYIPDGVTGQIKQTAEPTAQPTAAPTAQPTAELTVQPSDIPSGQPAESKRSPIQWEGTSWAAAYYEFIMNGGYKRSKQEFYSYPDFSYGPSFCLYDMDLDGTPELVAFNGSYVSAEAETYLYALQDRQVKYLGTVGEDISIVEYLDDPRYPGLFYESGRMGYYDIYYHDLDENGKLQWQQVMHIEEKMNYGYVVEPKTEDQTLFDLIKAGMWEYEPGQFSPDRSNDTLRLRGYTPEEIQAMGWGAFIAACPVYAFDTEEPAVPADETPEEVAEVPDNPLILPAEGERIDLWGSENLEVLWKAVKNAASYDITIRCSWPMAENNAVQTIYHTTCSETGDRNEYQLLIPREELDLDRVPEYKDLHIWVVLTVK